MLYPLADLSHSPQKKHSARCGHRVLASSEEEHPPPHPPHSATLSLCQGRRFGGRIVGGLRRRALRGHPPTSGFGRPVARPMGRTVLWGGMSFASPTPHAPRPVSSPGVGRTALPEISSGNLSFQPAWQAMPHLVPLTRVPSPSTCVAGSAGRLRLIPVVASRWSAPPGAAALERGGSGLLRKPLRLHLAVSPPLPTAPRAGDSSSTSSPARA